MGILSTRAVRTERTSSRLVRQAVPGGASVLIACFGALPALAQQADLVVSMSQSTTTASLAGPNSGLQTEIAVQNVGAVSTGLSFYARFFAASIGSPPCSSELGTIDQVLVDGLDPGELVDGIQLLGGVPGGITSPTSVDLCVEIDSTGYVTESDETNNLAVSAAPAVLVECLADADCDDFVACTVETCSENVCSSSPVTCDDGNACTEDRCEIQFDACVHEPVQCDDGDACTTDSCDPAQGCVSEPVVCDDGDPCTADACGSGIGCYHTPIECPPTVPMGGAGRSLLVLALLVAALGGLGVWRRRS